MAVRRWLHAGGSGDIAAGRVLWHFESNGPDRILGTREVAESVDGLFDDPGDLSFAFRAWRWWPDR